MFPARYSSILFGLILSGFMSLLVSGVAILRNVGPVAGFAGLWVGAWLPSWLIAFPVVLGVAPSLGLLIGARAAAPLIRVAMFARPGFAVSLRVTFAVASGLTGLALILALRARHTVMPVLPDRHAAVTK